MGHNDDDTKTRDEWQVLRTRPAVSHWGSERPGSPAPDDRVRGDTGGREGRNPSYLSYA